MKDIFKHEATIIFCKIYFEDISHGQLCSWLEFAIKCYPERIAKVLPSKKFNRKTEEAISQFLALMSALKIKQPKSKENLCQIYMSYVAYAVLENKLEIRDALVKTTKVLSETRDKKKYKGFLKIYSDMDILNANFYVRSLSFVYKEEIRTKILPQYLYFLEQSENSRLRVKLEKLDTAEIVEQKYFPLSEKSRLSNFIIDDILRKRKVDKKMEKAIRKGIRILRK